MRLQLIIGRVSIALVALAPWPAMAGHTETTARVDSYSDERVTVISPATRVAYATDDGTELEARYHVDALSGATPRLAVDGITSATRFEERRHEGHVGGQLRPTPSTTIGGTYTVSTEPDFRTHRMGVSGAVELLDRMATASAAYYVNFDRVGHSTDDDYRQHTVGHNVDLGWQHVLGRRTTMAFLATGRLDDCDPQLGCQANPYRYVGVGRGATWVVPERHPDRRVRGAGAIRLTQGLSPTLAAHAGYGYYGDSWRITAHTADVALAHGLWADRLVLRAEGRFTWQGAASFYHDTYEIDGAATDAGSAPAYRSSDRELAALWDASAGARGELSLSGIGPFTRLRLNARVIRLWYRYRNHSELPERHAWLSGVGLSAVF